MLYYFGRSLSGQAFRYIFLFDNFSTMLEETNKKDAATILNANFFYKVNDNFSIYKMSNQV